MNKKTKESPYKGSIFQKYFLNKDFVTSKRGQHFINEHMLYGWLATQEGISTNEIFKKAKSEFKRQWHLNQTYLDLITELGIDFEQKRIKPILLKGISFLGELYPDIGDRSMSDVDILISKDEVNTVIEILTRKGFKLTGNDKWKANNHKYELLKDFNGIELVLELHTSLFYHVSDPFWATIPYEDSRYEVLAPEECILYQCSHLGFQHTFIKLFWFIDIHLLLLKYKDLNEEKVLSMAITHKVYNALAMTIYILDQYFNSPMGPCFKKISDGLPQWKKSLLSEAFLLNPRGNYLRYLIVKHLCKDGLKESMAYNLGWLRNRFSKAPRGNTNQH